MTTEKNSSPLLLPLDAISMKDDIEKPWHKRLTSLAMLKILVLILSSAIMLGIPIMLVWYVQAWANIRQNQCGVCCMRVQVLDNVQMVRKAIKEAKAFDTESLVSGGDAKSDKYLEIQQYITSGTFADVFDNFVQGLMDIDCDEYSSQSMEPDSSPTVLDGTKVPNNRYESSSQSKEPDSSPTVLDGTKAPKRYKSSSQCDIVGDSFKFDCHPETGASQAVCESRNCCWQISDSNSLGVPACFYPTVYDGYSYVNVTKSDTGFLAFMNRSTKSYYPEDVELLKLEVIFETEYRLHIKITDALKKRYEVPIPLMPTVNTPSKTTDYDVKILPERGFQIFRVATGEILFDASVGGFLFADQFIQISALLPSGFLYGLGEQRDSFVRSFNWKRIVLFAKDHFPEEDVNIYGVHPFYLMMEGSSRSHGVYFHNSNAMEIILQPTPAITYRTIGGVLDFYFFLGPSPGDVVSQYTELIGRPFLPPYWSLGFHLCRYNYGSVNQTKEVWQRTRDAGIPFDVQWNDIDYMDKERDFTIGGNYTGLKNFVDEIHQVGMHYIPMVDCAIAATSKRGEYPPFDDGNDMDIFVKDWAGKNFIGQVWPGDSVWPDFTNMNATSYWAVQLQKFHDKVPYDGIWLDMNEPSNFITGTEHGCPDTKWDNPPYLPAVHGGALAYLTVCMSARQNASLHYDVHSLYGLTETMATNYALVAVRKKRPFIISRSSYPGHGFYGGHWTGDINSQWHDMRRSVSDILNFNMFGIPMVGADICGFNENTTKKLCQRWMELGAFYGFARNHNDKIAIDQDPVALGPDVVVASVKAFYTRYQLLPYLYTLFYRAHVSGSTVARPLFFEFPKDRKTYTIDTQFLWGSALMILPVLEEDVTTINPYFPLGVWYLLPSLRTIRSLGTHFRVDSPLDTITIALRGGFIIPVQDVNQTTTASRLQMFGLNVALNETGEAAGEVFWDDGDTLGTIKNAQYNLLHFQANQNTLTSRVETFAYHGENSMTLGKVSVYGIRSNITKVAVDGKAWTWFKYNKTTEMLTIDRLMVRLTNPFSIVWG